MPGAAFFTILSRVDSTNNYAMQQVHEGLAKHGQAWFAIEQTAGKGQRGNSWSGEKGKNIALSIALEPEMYKPVSQFHLGAAVALACLTFLVKYAGEEIKIKWPNDLYWRDRKAGGILIENKLQGNKWKWAVVGIGINVNQTTFDNHLTNAVSLKQVTGKTFDVETLARELHEQVLNSLSGLKSPGKTLQAYNANLYKINHLVTLKKAGVKFDTVIKEVSPQGKLVTVDALEREFDFGEVQWVL